ncbi:CsbD family protein [Saccharothrix sp. ST-888]|uniref:CsbD family protein n=1 Tax=Saccharothrix sp. ST-888 TaxID=1427391 RepID=UPI0005EBFC79|nr:CsbD family protein [Saccharothrix sp. ST-888]KJK59335.1 general stress protein CsbD [Saccharothrix sp. ST-888]
MSGADKVRNMAEKAKGHAKEAAGKALGDKRLTAEGKADKVSGDAKQAGEKVKDIAKD